MDRGTHNFHTAGSFAGGGAACLAQPFDGTLDHVLGDLVLFGDPVNLSWFQALVMEKFDH